MTPETIAWIILFLPLAAAVGIPLITRRNAALSAQLSIGAVALSFLLSIAAAVLYSGMDLKGQPMISTVNWVTAGDWRVDIALRLDWLSILMLLIVTGVGGAIHIYSYAYMHDDKGMARYFASLSLFTFSMLGIVLSNNFVMMFIFWELVGLSSYLLIGFWFDKPAAADACKKAFLTNRLGDFGFILGIILIWGLLGSVDFDALVIKLNKDPKGLGIWAGVAGLLIFCGAMGKSAQFPLHVWLPDAMEGPTPVSALIHAATMVAAGVYLLCRTYFLFSATVAWPEALSFLGAISPLDIIAWIGGLTALMAALIAVQQNDIKRILAYSTLSQLGYMVMAVGLQGPGAGMYHLITHAFFKAMLFLGAGSVIHALHHEQDIWRMGGLKQKMPITFWTFLIGTLALCGVPPFSGFYSKDEILAQASSHSLGLFIVAVIVAVLTTFYMFRLVFVAFLGGPKTGNASHAHESPKLMTVPLLVLAVPSIFAGFFGIKQLLEAQLGDKKVLAHAAEHLNLLDQVFAPFNHAPMAAGLGLLAVLFGFFAAFGLYSGAASDPLPSKLGALSRAMQNRFYFDELYASIIALTQDAFATVADWFDRWIISGLFVKGLTGVTELFGRALRVVQTGNLQTYSFLFVAGLALLLLYVLRH